MCEKSHQLLAVGRWFPPGTPVSFTIKLISSSYHRLDMTLAVAEALNPNNPPPPPPQKKKKTLYALRAHTPPPHTHTHAPTHTPTATHTPLHTHIQY